MNKDLRPTAHADRRNLMLSRPVAGRARVFPSRGGAGILAALGSSLCGEPIGKRIMFGRKKGRSTPPPPAAASASETLANSPVRERGGLSLRKPQPARPQQQPRVAGPANGPGPRLSGITIPPAARPPGATTPAGQGDGKILVVGRAIVLSGEIAACDKLVVEGRVSAELRRCPELEITRSGRFSGIAEVDTAEILGHFDGELTAHRVTVRASARVSGKIRYGEMIMEPGAQVHGEIAPIKPEALDEEPA
jgi:cytoskeletal protein CcmA (bactofilin family)